MSARRSGPVVFVLAAALPAFLWHRVVADIASEFRLEPASLVWLVGGIFAAAVAVGLFVADARSPSYALGSELVYRIEIRTVVVVLLFVLTTSRLASYGRTFTTFGAGPVKTEADDPASAVDAIVLDVERLGDDAEATAAELKALSERVAALEDRLAG